MRKLICVLCIIGCFAFAGCANPMHDNDYPSGTASVDINARALELGFSSVTEYTAYVDEQHAHGDHSNCDVMSDGNHSVCDHVDHQGTCHDGSSHNGTSHDNHDGHHH
jgi:hypothetical protein